jgi:hypothetical protein
LKVTRNAYGIIVGKPGVGSLFGRPRRISDDNKMDLDVKL